MASAARLANEAAELGVAIRRDVEAWLKGLDIVESHEGEDCSEDEGLEIVGEENWAGASWWRPCDDKDNEWWQPQQQTGGWTDDSNVWINWGTSASEDAARDQPGDADAAGGTEPLTEGWEVTSKGWHREDAYRDGVTTGTWKRQGSHDADEEHGNEEREAFATRGWQWEQHTEMGSGARAWQNGSWQAEGWHEESWQESWQTEAWREDPWRHDVAEEDKGDSLCPPSAEAEMGGSSNSGSKETARSRKADEWKPVLKSKEHQIIEERPRSGSGGAGGGWQAEGSTGSAGGGKDLPATAAQNGEGASAEVLSGLFDALAKLIESHDGMLPGTAFEKLYDQHSAYRGIVKAAGGPKKFAELHGDRFQWTLRGLPGGSIELVASSAAPATAATSAHAASMVAPSAGGATWKATTDQQHQQEQQPSDEPSEEPGGGGGGKGGMCDVLVEMIEWEGGSLLASKVFLTIRSWYPRKAPRLKRECEEAGSLKEFVLRHPQLFDWTTVPDMPGRDAICLVKASGTSIAVEALRTIITQHNGSIVASQISKAAKALEAEPEEALRAEVQRAGGIKTFVCQNLDDFEWYLQGRAGMYAVRLAEAKTSSATTPALQHLRPPPPPPMPPPPDAIPVASEGDAAAGQLARGCDGSSQGGSEDQAAHILAELIEWYGGSILACQVFPRLNIWDSSKLDIVKSDVQIHGGMRSYIKQHANNFEWFLENGAGTESIRLVQVPEKEVQPRKELALELAYQ